VYKRQDDYSWYGIVYDLSSLITTEGERDLPLEPFRINSITVSHTTDVSRVGMVQVVYFVPEFEPDDYGIDELRPGYRGEWVIGYRNQTAGVTSPVGFTIDGQDGIVPNPIVNDAITFPAGHDNPTTNRGGLPINAADTRNTAANWGRLQSYIQNSQWTGRLALTVYNIVDAASRGPSWPSVEGALAFVEDGPVTTAVHSSFHTGQIGAPMRKRCRVRHDPKSGFPGLSDEFVKDGYREGMMVLPDSWDPEDRTGQDFYPPPNEGVVDDEVP